MPQPSHPPPELERSVMERKGLRRGEEIDFCCPFPQQHQNGDANPSARYNTRKRTWYCDVCRQGGGWQELCKLLGISRPHSSKPTVTATYIYCDEEGNPLRRKLRFEPGFGGRAKSFSWEKPDGNGGWVKCQGDGNPKALYGSEKLPEARKSEHTVFVVEGEKDADRGTSLGLVTVCNPEGAAQGKRAKWKARYSMQLERLPVVVIADKDDAGRSHAQAVAASLFGKVPSLKLVELPGEGVNDLSDWVAQEERSGFNTEEIRAALESMVDTAEIWIPDTSSADASSASEENGRRKPTQAEILISLADAAGAELFHTPSRDSFVTVPVGGHRETWPIPSKNFRHWLVQGFYRETRKAPSSQSLQDARNSLEARAIVEGAQREVFIRVAGTGSTIWLDLCNEDWEIVEVTASGWQVLGDAPVRFHRTASMEALPLPVSGGSIGDLKPLVNLSGEDQFILFVAFLLAVLRPNGPYPVLVVHGEQGSGKSTLARIARFLTDPNGAPLRTLPRSERDLMISSQGSWILAFDNVSGLRPWLSDALCRMATGGGLATRQLYTDSEEVIFSATRPTILNGIDEVIGRQDLVDRSLILSLPTIPEDRRQREEELWAKVEAIRPRILGALLDAVSRALKDREQLRLERLPRMADFAHWVVAAEPALPWPGGAFLEAYETSRSESVEASLEADPVAVALREFITAKGNFEGTATELLTELASHASEVVQRSRSWPKSARALSGRLNRAATFLRQVGLEVIRGDREPGTGRRLIRIKKKPESNRHNRHNHHTDLENQVVTGDDCDDKPESVTVTADDRHSANHMTFGRRDESDGCDDEMHPYSGKTSREVFDL